MRTTLAPADVDFLAEYGPTVRASRRWHAQAPCLYEEALEHFYYLQYLAEPTR